MSLFKTLFGKPAADAPSSAAEPLLPARSSGPMGILDYYLDGVVTGWAYDPGLTEPMTVDIYVDGEKVGSTLADRIREDLLSIVPKGKCGFYYQINDGFPDGEKHTIEVFYGGTRVHVPNSPVAEEGQWIGDQKRWRKKIPPLALVGHNDWLFLAQDNYQSVEQYNGSRQLSDDELRHYVETFRQRESYLRGMNIPYVCMASPSKDSVYPEHMPASVKLSSSGKPLDQVHAALTTEGIGCFVDARPAMRAGKRAHTLYHPNDTHWNAFGAYWGYYTLMHALRCRLPKVPEPLPLSAFEVIHEEFPTADLVAKSACDFDNGTFTKREGFSVDASITAPRLTHREPPAIRQLETPAALNVSKTRDTLVFETDDPALPTAVMFRGSNADWFMHLIAPHFRRIVFVWHNYLHREVIESEKPEIVFQVFNERLILAPPRV